MEEWLGYRLGDFLMFSGRAYWRLFELENAALWPLPLVAPVLGGVALLLLRRRRGLGLRLLAILLALAWALSGWSFVWQRYAPINWGIAYAAPLFGVQALLLLGRAAAPKAGSARLAGVRGATGMALLAWGLVLHPFTTPLFGRPIMGAEVVGIAPDPTAIATLGLALLLPSPPRSRLLVAAIPALWLGFSALTLHLLGAPERAVPLVALAAGVGALALGRR